MGEKRDDLFFKNHKYQGEENGRKETFSLYLWEKYNFGNKCVGKNPNIFDNIRVVPDNDLAGYPACRISGTTLGNIGGELSAR